MSASGNSSQGLSGICKDKELQTAMVLVWWQCRTGTHVPVLRDLVLRYRGITKKSLSN